MDYRVKVFKALANQRRLTILKILSKEKLTGISVATRIKLSPKSTSKHLIKLEEVGLIKREYVSRYAFYSIVSKKLLKNLNQFA
jgi:ArsR family transcriptional regulator